jgi:hypothetical protein
MPQAWVLQQRRPRGTSLVHENGFTKISLWKFDNGCLLRLHIWPEAGFVDSRIHSHRWKLSSFCMEGALTALNYAEDPQAPPINTFRLDDEVNGRKESAFLARKSLAPGSVYTVTRGEGHYLHHAIMHRVSKPEGVHAITLMLSGVAQNDHSIISEADCFQAPQRQFIGSGSDRRRA